MARFRELRTTENEIAAFRGQRKRQWFTIKAEHPAWPCCYAIFIDGALVYIGQTENLQRRMQQHRNKGATKGVDRSRLVLKAKLPRRFGEWAMTEIRLIKRLRPMLNSARVFSLGETRP